MNNDIRIHPWSYPVTDIEQFLHSNVKSGLSSQSIRAITGESGKNVLEAEKKTGRFKILLRQFDSPMIYTLLLATGIALYLGEMSDAIAILAIVILNAAIGYFQESQAEAAILALKKLTVPKARVFREGVVTVIDSSEVLPGDILVFEAGDYVVADGRLIKASQLSADESVLTGESLPVQKTAETLPSDTLLSERVNMLFAGTAISSGSGRAIVTGTGMNTEIGKIAHLLQETKFSKSPLQERLDKVSNHLLKIGGLVIIVVSILGLLKGENWSLILMSGIGLAVAAIPEGLPTVVTLALALAIRRMTKRNALVRKMNAVETLGSTDIICTDKTGTLTTGKMKVREIYSSEEGLKKSDENFQDMDFFKNIVLCNNASLEQGGSGDTTEVALLNYARERGINITGLRKDFVRIHEWSFDSDRKRMSVVIQEGESARIFCKGAPETLLPLCRITPETRSELEKVIQEFSQKGRRLLGLASARGELKDYSKLKDTEVEKNLSFLGLVSIADPPKEESISSIRNCKQAGIKVVMITGDHPVTAHAVAMELGIPEEGSFDQVLTGEDLNSFSEEELQKAVERTAVYARVSPEHKLVIIKALLDNGHIVSMTGDGVNDAPALKKASIGVAMGKSGTEVARQASSIILTDDNFSTIVSAVEEGRAIFGNIKRTIQYLLSTNLGELLIMLVAAILLLPSPLTPLALLWINLVTDGLPSLALAAEPVEKNFLLSSGGPSPGSFFDRIFLIELMCVGILMMIIVMSVYLYALNQYDHETAKSYAFALMVYLSLFRSFSCRSEVRTYFELPFNKWHFASVMVPVILQLVLPFSATFRELFEVRIMSLEENAILLGLGLIPFIVVEIYKIGKRMGRRARA